MGLMVRTSHGRPMGGHRHSARGGGGGGARRVSPRRIATPQVCRGPSIMLVCPTDGLEEIANPFLQEEGEEEDD